MKFYIEITLLPNAEVGTNFLLPKVFQQLHLALVEIKNPQNQVPIGISFPEYVGDKKAGIVGSKIRLFAKDESTLTKFDAIKWLSRLSDYVHLTDIRPVPEKLKGYAIYQRHQPKTNNDSTIKRLTTRRAKREGISFEEALKHYDNMPSKTVSLPFIHIKSLSGDREFCLWIKKTETSETSHSTYSTYGLSPKSAVPEF